MMPSPQPMPTRKVILSIMARVKQALAKVSTPSRARAEARVEASLVERAKDHLVGRVDTMVVVAGAIRWPREATAWGGRPKQGGATSP